MMLRGTAAAYLRSDEQDYTSCRCNQKCCKISCGCRSKGLICNSNCHNGLVFILPNIENEGLLDEIINASKDYSTNQKSTSSSHRALTINAKELLQNRIFRAINKNVTNFENNTSFCSNYIYVYK